MFIVVKEKQDGSYSYVGIINEKFANKNLLCASNSVGVEFHLMNSLNYNTIILKFINEFYYLDLPFYILKMKYDSKNEELIKNAIENDIILKNGGKYTIDNITNFKAFLDDVFSANKNKNVDLDDLVDAVKNDKSLKSKINYITSLVGFY